MRNLSFSKKGKKYFNNFLVTLYPDATEMKSRPERKIRLFMLHTFANKNKYTAQIYDINL